MAKRKITVKFNGKVIGTRTTDRIYTHALVLTDFDPAVVRARDAADWLKWGRSNAKSAWFHAKDVAGPDYKYASGVSDAERAACVAVAALSFDEHLTQTHAARLLRLEQHIAKCISQGARVLSYHGSRDLAFKAQAAARNVHPEYLVLVEPVEDAQAERDRVHATLSMMNAINLE